MAWINPLKSIAGDDVRLLQAFTLCRQTGIILGSIVVARVLPLGEVGILELLVLCGYLMTFFWSDAFIKGYLAKKGELEISTSAFLLFCFMLGLISMSLLFVLRHVLVPLFTDQDQLQGLALFGLYQAIVVPLWLAPYMGALTKHNVILASVFVLVGPSFATWVGHTSLNGIDGILIGLLSYALVGFGWILTQVQWKGDLHFLKLLNSLWPITWPLILYAVSSAIAKSLDAWLVAHYFTESEFAIFRYGAREFPLVVALAAGVSTIMIPKLLENSALHELKMRSTRLMNLCYPVVAVLMLFSPPLFAFVFGSAFRSSAFIFNIYLLLTLTQLVFPQSIMTARGDTKILWIISLFELAINVSVSLLLMTQFGLVGIVWGTLVAFAFEKILLLLLVYKRYHISPREVFNSGTLTGYMALFIVTFILSSWLFGI